MHLKLLLVACCPGPPKPRVMQRKKLSPRSLLLSLMSSASLASIMLIASRAERHKANETYHSHQAEEERTEFQEEKEGLVIHMDGKHSKAFKRKSNHPSDHCKVEW